MNKVANGSGWWSPLELAALGRDRNPHLHHGSTTAGPSIHRPELELSGRPTRLLVDQVRSIDVRYVVRVPVDYRTRDQLTLVEVALAHYLGVQAVSPPRSS